MSPMKGMILVAGEGLRARPLTNYYAKPALPLPGCRIVTHLIRFLRDAGTDEIALNLHYKPETIYQALKDDPVERVRIHPFDEPVLAGSGGGFYRIRDFFGDKTFVVLNGDSVGNFNLKEMIDFHKNHGGLMTFLCQPDSSRSTRVIDANRGGEVLSIRKRPASPDSSASYKFCGAMVIEPEIFKYFPDSEVIDLIEDVLIPTLERGEKIGRVYSPEFIWLDFGTIDDYFKNSFLFLKDFFPETEHVSEYEKKDNAYTHKSADIPKTLDIKGTSFIDKNCTIGENCRIKDSILYHNVFLKNNTTVENSILLGSPPDNTDLKSSIILPDGDTYQINS